MTAKLTDITLPVETTPVESIRETIRMIWDSQPGLLSGAWCGACGADLLLCRCGVADAMRSEIKRRRSAERDREREAARVALPPARLRNRAERRRDEALKRRTKGR